MAQGDENDKRAARTREHIGTVDKQIASPSERAALVWNLLRSEHPDLTDWDLICFSTEYLGMMVQVHPWLEELAKKLAALVYTAHYLTPDTDVSSSIERRDPEGSEPRDRQEGSNASTERKGDSNRIVRTRISFGGSDTDVGS